MVRFDRFDLQIDIAPVDGDELIHGEVAESSQGYLSTGQKARVIQQERYKNIDLYCNAQLQGNQFTIIFFAQ